jgi:uncharacterized damage-inducible protein DinB
MSRFEGGGKTTPPLNSILFDDFAALRQARAEEDAHIEAFFEHATREIFDRSLSYTNSRGQDYVDPTAVAVAHLFNHQTHHRGQAHCLLTAITGDAPSLDMIVLQRERGWATAIRA